MCGIGVVVDATVEDCRGVLAKTALDHSLATRVFIDEVSDIVNDAGNCDETTAVADLVNIVIPLNNWQLLKWYTPVELGALLVELLLLLLDTALLDFVGAELLQIVGQTQLAPEGNRPLGGIILVPFDSVAVV